MFSGLQFDCMSSIRVLARPPAYIMNMYCFYSNKKPLKAFSFELIFYVFGRCHVYHVCVRCAHLMHVAVMFPQNEMKKEHFGFFTTRKCVQCTHTQTYIFANIFSFKVSNEPHQPLLLCALFSFSHSILLSF